MVANDKDNPPFENKDEFHKEEPQVYEDENEPLSIDKDDTEQFKAEKEQPHLDITDPNYLKEFEKNLCIDIEKSIKVSPNTSIEKSPNVSPKTSIEKSPRPGRKEGVSDGSTGITLSVPLSSDK